MTGYVVYIDGVRYGTYTELRTALESTRTARFQGNHTQVFRVVPSESEDPTD